MQANSITSKSKILSTCAYLMTCPNLTSSKTGFHFPCLFLPFKFHYIKTTAFGHWNHMQLLLTKSKSFYVTPSKKVYHRKKNHILQYVHIFLPKITGWILKHKFVIGERTNRAEWQCNIQQNGEIYSQPNKWSISKCNVESKYKFLSPHKMWNTGALCDRKQYRCVLRLLTSAP